MIITEIKDYPFLMPFVEKVKEIAEEYRHASQTVDDLKYYFKGDEMPPTPSHFGFWVQESGFDVPDIGYDARGDKPVGGFPLFKEDFPILRYNVEESFPLINKLLMSIPNLHYAQFSLMSPHSHILPHEHKFVKNSTIFHINLFDLDGDAVFTVNDDKFHYNKQGDYFLFNPHYIHESENKSNSYRVTLMLDFREPI